MAIVETTMASFPVRLEANHFACLAPKSLDPLLELMSIHRSSIVHLCTIFKFTQTVGRDRSDAYFVFPLALRTTEKQCGLIASGDYPPSLRSQWRPANENHCHQSFPSLSPLTVHPCTTSPRLPRDSVPSNGLSKAPAVHAHQP